MTWLEGPQRWTPTGRHSGGGEGGQRCHSHSSLHYSCYWLSSTPSCLPLCLPLSVSASLALRITWLRSRLTSHSFPSSRGRGRHRRRADRSTDRLDHRRHNWGWSRSHGLRTSERTLPLSTLLCLAPKHQSINHPMSSWQQCVTSRTLHRWHKWKNVNVNPPSR